MTPTFTIQPEDPMVAGHFPDNPIVPGVALLDRAILYAEAQTHRPVVSVASVKFVRPVLPGLEVELRLSQEGERVTVDAVIDNDLAMRASLNVGAG